jgi:hypothetical protein
MKVLFSRCKDTLSKRICQGWFSLAAEFSAAQI